MSDPNQNSPNHWDVLSSLLGTTPSPEDTEPRQPSPPPAPAAPPRKTPKHQSAPASRPTNWDSLAGELGLQPAPPQSEPRSEPQSEPSPSRAAPPPLPEPSRLASPPPETPEESPNFFDERFDFEEPFDLLESSEPPTASAETPAETAESTEEKRPPRRRRRRRGRGGQGRESREGMAPADKGDLDREPSTDQEEAADQPRESGAAEDGESPEQRKRRRPRRGRSRRDRKDSAAAGAAKGSRADAASTTLPDPEMLETDLLVGEGIELGKGEPDEQGEDQQSARLGFRGIPTWEEVIGMLVTKNVEARSRRPAGGPHHGRGNRGSHSNRGGQGGKRRS